jgi:catabolite repression HPr-like protein/phosphocarrier protein
MSVMSLRAKPGTQLRILATGPDETVALEALSAMLRTRESF